MEVALRNSAVVVSKHGIKSGRSAEIVQSKWLWWVATGGKREEREFLLGIPVTQFIRRVMGMEVEVIRVSKTLPMLLQPLIQTSKTPFSSLLKCLYPFHFSN